jgi:hypothetical protein
MVVDNIKGTHSSDGSGSTDDPTYRSIVSASSPTSAGYELQLETTDGKISSCRINGKTFDLAKGGLFLIRAAGDQVEVRQIDRDLKSIVFDSKRCLDYVEKDAEIRTILGTNEWLD